MEPMFMTVEEIQQACDCSRSKAYAIIRAMNQELVNRGFLVMPGKVSRAFFHEKVYQGKGATT